MMKYDLHLNKMINVTYIKNKCLCSNVTYNTLVEFALNNLSEDTVDITTETMNSGHIWHNIHSRLQLWLSTKEIKKIDSQSAHLSMSRLLKPHNISGYISILKPVIQSAI